MHKHGSDKGGSMYSNHNYTSVYEPLLYRLKSLGNSVNLFELGLGTINPNLNSSMHWVQGYIPGASQIAWSEWLPEANIYAADIDCDTLFETDKIKTYHVDQTSSESVQAMWSKIDVDFDVIIDDGVHEFEANHTFLLNSHHKLKDGGIYIIENVLNESIPFFDKKVPEYLSIFKSVSLVPPWHRNNLDNNLLIMIK